MESGSPPFPQPGHQEGAQPQHEGVGIQTHSGVDGLPGKGGEVGSAEAVAEEEAMGPRVEVFIPGTLPVQTYGGPIEEKTQEFIEGRLDESGAMASKGCLYKTTHREVFAWADGRWQTFSIRNWILLLDLLVFALFWVFVAWVIVEYGRPEDDASSSDDEGSMILALLICAGALYLANLYLSLRSGIARSMDHKLSHQELQAHLHRLRATPVRVNVHMECHHEKSSGSMNREATTTTVTTWSGDLIFNYLVCQDWTPPDLGPMVEADFTEVSLHTVCTFGDAATATAFKQQKDAFVAANQNRDRSHTVTVHITTPGEEVHGHHILAYRPGAHSMFNSSAFTKVMGFLTLGWVVKARVRKNYGKAKLRLNKVIRGPTSRTQLGHNTQPTFGAQSGVPLGDFNDGVSLRDLHAQFAPPTSTRPHHLPATAPPFAPVGAGPQPVAIVPPPPAQDPPMYYQPHPRDNYYGPPVLC